MDMVELLKDHMEVERCLQESDMGPASQVATRSLGLVVLLQLPVPRGSSVIVSLLRYPYHSDKKVWWARLVPV